MTVDPRLTTGRLDQRPAPSPRYRPTRPSTRNQSVRAPLFVVVEPRVEQVPKAEFAGHRANLLAGQDPTDGRDLERLAIDPKSSSGHRSSPRRLSLVSLSHARGAVQNIGAGRSRGNVSGARFVIQRFAGRGQRLD